MTNINAVWPLKSIKGLSARRRKFTDVSTIPTGNWTGADAIPAVGAEVTVNLHNLGAAVVLGYWLSGSREVGLIVKFQDPPGWYLKQNKKVNLPGIVFGSEL